MVNLIRCTYPTFLGLVLFVFLISCGDDEVVDDIGPVALATPEGIIKGTITDLVTHQGVMDAHVVLVREKKLPGGDLEQEDIASTTTNSSGSFIFEELKGGDYTLKLNAPGYIDQQAMVKISRKESATANFRLEPGVRFRGKVVSDDGNPVRDVLISLGDRATVTGGGGFFEISPVSKGQYNLTAEKPGYHTTHIPSITIGDSDVSRKISIEREVTGQIIFVRGDVAGKDFFGISAINANRTGEQPLTHLSDLQPTWSPNGREIVFSRSENGRLPQIYIMDSRGGNARAISGDHVNDRHPAWSPDGNRIAFVHARALGQPAIYTMNVNGENRVRLSDCYADARPTWSPDGNQIVYTHTLLAENRNLFAVDIDTFLAAKEAPLTKVIPDQEKKEGDPPQAPSANPLVMQEGVHRLTNSLNHDIHPDWSPDGSKLVFTKESDSFSAAVYVLDLFSLRRTRLTTESGYNGYPCWSPDGTKIVFSSNRNGSLGIWMMDADGSNKALIFDELSQDDILSQHAWRE